MGRILFLMFVAFIMILILMGVSKWLNRPKKVSKEESRDSFVKELNELQEITKKK
jgi:hypothetical protein